MLSYDCHSQTLSLSSISSFYRLQRLFSYFAPVVTLIRNPPEFCSHGFVSGIPHLIVVAQTSMFISVSLASLNSYCSCHFFETYPSLSYLRPRSAFVSHSSKLRPTTHCRCTDPNFRCCIARISEFASLVFFFEMFSSLTIPLPPRSLLAETLRRFAVHSRRLTQWVPAFVVGETPPMAHSEHRCRIVLWPVSGGSLAPFPHGRIYRSRSRSRFALYFRRSLVRFARIAATRVAVSIAPRNAVVFSHRSASSAGP